MAVPKVNLPNLPSPLARLRRTASRAGLETGQRFIPEETAIAFTYNGFSYAVMTADLEDLAAGLSLTERIVAVEHISDLEVVPNDLAIELRMSIPKRPCGRIQLNGGTWATGCGLCGIESLHEASHPTRRVGARLRVTPEVISTAMAALNDRIFAVVSPPLILGAQHLN
jgi:FdhD protein